MWCVCRYNECFKYIFFDDFFVLFIFRGGFIFVLNLIALHAAVLAIVNLLRGHYSVTLYRAYSLFFIVGTFWAVQVPIIGWNPFRSLEQLAGFVVFLCLQLLHIAEQLRLKKNAGVWSLAAFKIKAQVFVLAFILFR